MLVEEVARKPGEADRPANPGAGSGNSNGNGDSVGGNGGNQKPDKASKAEKKRQETLAKQQARKVALERAEGPKSSSGENLQARLDKLAEKYKKAGKELAKPPRVDVNNGACRQVTIFTPSNKKIIVTLGRRVHPDAEVDQLSRLVDQVEAQ